MDSKLCSKYIEGRCFYLLERSAVYEKCIYKGVNNVNEQEIKNCSLGKAINELSRVQNSKLEKSLISI
jgi:hypothetical protein